MDVSECPWCGLINPPEAKRCDCGYDFTSGTFEAPYITKESQLGERSRGAGLNPVRVLFGWPGVLIAEIFGLLRRLAALGRIGSLPRKDDATASEIAKRLQTTKAPGAAVEPTNITRRPQEADPPAVDSVDEKPPSTSYHGTMPK